MDVNDRALWERVLTVDETSHEYFAQREDAPGAVLFTSRENPESNLALLQQTSPADAGRLLDNVIAHYSALGMAARVRVTPLSRPEDWPQRLAARGFHPLPEEDELFMVRTKADAPIQATGRLGNPRVAVRRVFGDGPAAPDAAVFTQVQRTGFGMDEEGLEHAVQATRKALAAGSYRFYVAYLGNEPVAAASVRLAREATGGVAGLYGLATLPEARRLGVGESLVRFLVQEALAEGYDVVFLSAEPGSRAAGLYQRLGFAPVFSVRNYLRPLGAGEPAAVATKG